MDFYAFVDAVEKLAIQVTDGFEEFKELSIGELYDKLKDAINECRRPLSYLSLQSGVN